jgi:proline iminopeptidase
MSGPIPRIEPYENGMLDGGDGHQVYWECRGNRAEKPALFLHGGSGSGCSAGQRPFFDPHLFSVI